MIDLQLDGNAVTLELNRMCDDAARFKVLMKALVKGGIVVRDNARAKFQQRLGNTSFRYSEDVDGPLYEAIRVKNHGDYVTVTINSDYRMKWWEKGTKDRYTKSKKILYDRVREDYQSSRGVRRRYQRSGKGGYRGKVKDFKFLSDARAQSSGTVDIIVKKSINEGLLKLLRK